MRLDTTPRFALWTCLLLVATTLASCATNFSPELVRREIVVQRGVDPLAAFELDLGRFTTLLIKTAIANEHGEVPFEGLDALQLAVYRAPSPEGPVIDVGRIVFKGWDTALRFHDEKHSGMVLVQPGNQNIADLVVIGAGVEKVVYARLSGRLDPDLPATLGDVLRRGGPDEVQRLLRRLGE